MCCSICGLHHYPNNQWHCSTFNPLCNVLTVVAKQQTYKVKKDNSILLCSEISLLVITGSLLFSWRRDLSGHTTFNLKGSSIPTVSELPCCSFRSCHTRLTNGRCSNYILHDRGFGLNGLRQVQEWHSMHTELFIYKNIISICLWCHSYRIADIFHGGIILAVK